VGSEADLAGLIPQDLTVAVDPDGLILGSHYRSAEEALRILARLAGRVAGRGSRCLVQTYLPEHAVIVALRKGDPLVFLESEMEQRRQFGFPPAGELLVLEVRGELPGGADTALKEAATGATVMGPATRNNGGIRWLLQASDLSKARHNLRGLIQKWRDAGVTVRVDADPLEL
jgi:primosomal protein N' (replication factor Y)